MTKLEATLDKAKTNRTTLNESKERATAELATLQEQRDRVREVAQGSRPGLSQDQIESLKDLDFDDRDEARVRLTDKAQRQAEKDAQKLGNTIDKLLDGTATLDTKIEKARAEFDTAQAALDDAIVAEGHKAISALARKAEGHASEFKALYNSALDGLAALEASVAEHNQCMLEASEACRRTGTTREQGPKENIEVDFAELMEIPAVPLRYLFGSELRRRYK